MTERGENVMDAIFMHVCNAVTGIVYSTIVSTKVQRKESVPKVLPVRQNGFGKWYALHLLLVFHLHPRSSLPSKRR